MTPQITDIGAISLAPAVSAVPSEALAYALAQTLFHFLWQGCVLAVLACCVLQWIGSRPQTRYAVYLTLLAALAVCPLATFAALYGQATSDAVAQGDGEMNAQLSFDAVAAYENAGQNAVEPSPEWLRMIFLSAGAFVQSNSQAIVGVWLVGAAIFAVRLAVAALGVRRLVRSRQSLPANARLDFDRLVRCLAFRTRPVVAMVHGLSQAMTVGVIKPIVLLPACWVTELDPRMLEAVVAHELAHVRRWDVQINFLQRLIEAALFFHPVVWWCSRRLRVEREMCCDELAWRAIDNRSQYAEALTFLAHQRQASVPALAAPIGGSRMMLLARIRNVLGLSSREHGRLYGPSCAMAGAAAASLVWGALMFASRDTQPLATVDANDAAAAAPQEEQDKMVYTPAPRWAADSAPTEQRKMTLPTYTIEPPDILQIDNVRLLPKQPYPIRTGDVFSVEIEEPVADNDAQLRGLTDAIARDPERLAANLENPVVVGQRRTSSQVVDAAGAVDLGPVSGKVKVSGLSEHEASQAMIEVLRKNLPAAQISVRLESASLQPVKGEHLVSPDGSINLGTYGQVYVAGMTIQEATAAVNARLGQQLLEPNASLSVFAYNSKVYYLITENGGHGDQIYRMPITGNETVLDAISQVKGQDGLSSKAIWIARPTSGGSGSDVVLPVNLQEITRGASTKTNYQVLPGDRIFVSARATKKPAAKY